MHVTTGELAKSIMVEKIGNERFLARFFYNLIGIGHNIDTNDFFEFIYLK